MASVIAYGLIIIGFINLIWFAFWVLLTWSGEVGVKLSKKLGTDNENTDQYAGIARSYKKEAIQKTIISAVLIGAGYLIKYFYEV
ncbi:MAG: hypothetical protein OEZ34_03220 [Spirochaetia bacterium]|nr:hypothetical protein [Spirochaetia bacterium]